MAKVDIHARLDLKIDQDLKDWIVAYAKKKQTTVTSLVCRHFAELRAEEERERELVEQI
jgi:hypothetical protein